MNQHSSIDSSTTSTGAPDAVSRRAYELWESEGRPEGCDMRHWLQAEQELSNRGQSRSEPATGNGTAVPARNSDVTPLQGTRAASAATAGTTGRDPKRAAPPASYSSEKNGGSQNAARRKPSSAPTL